jgi:CRP-like cAMP-binding protein
MSLEPYGLPDSLEHVTTRRQYRTGETIFHRGDPVTSIYAVAEGRVRLVRHAADGRAVTLYVAGPGDSFAEAALFSDRYHCDAVAEVDSTISAVPKAALRDGLARDPALAERFMAHMARQLRDLRSLLELRNIQSARERVLAWLLLAGADTGLELDRPLKVVASEIGLTHETLYRTVAQLEKEGTIRRNKRQIVLVNCPEI